MMQEESKQEMSDFLRTSLRYNTEGCPLHSHQRGNLKIQRIKQFIYTVKLGYSNIGFCDTLSIASNIQ
jgi:hypothetical protein